MAIAGTIHPGETRKERERELIIIPSYKNTSASRLHLCLRKDRAKEGLLRCCPHVSHQFTDFSVLPGEEEIFGEY